MSVNQDLRTGSADSNNPFGLVYYVKPGRFLTPSSGPPDPSLGTAYDEYIDTSTGIEYIKDFSTGNWEAVINYSTLPITVPDPLTINHLNVANIAPDTGVSNDIQCTLPSTSNFVKVGVTGNLTNLQIGGDGSIISDSATAAHIVADGSGNQITYGSTTLTSTSALTVVGNSGVNIISNSGDISINSANNIIENAISQYQQQISNSTIMQNTGTSIGAYIPVLSNLAATSPQFSSFTDATSGVSSGAGFVNLFASGTQVLQASTGALFVGSNTIDAQSGTVGFPSYAFASDSQTGIYLASPGNLGLSCTGVNSLALSTTAVTSSVNVLPSTNGTLNLGSAGSQFQNIYLVNNPIVSSDGRLKKEITSLNSNLGLSFIEALDPITFKWKDNSDDHKHFGFLAQHMESTLIKSGYKVNEFDVVRNIDDKYHVTHSALIACLVKSVQQLSAKCNDLEKRIYDSQAHDNNDTQEVVEEQEPEPEPEPVKTKKVVISKDKKKIKK